MRMLIWALAAMAFTAGCTTHESDSILTSGIHATLGATADGDGDTTVYGTLYLGNPVNLDFVDLVGDDQLVASHDGMSRIMTESELLGTVAYRTSFTGDGEDLEFHIALERSVDDGAPDSYCTLPAPFDIVTDAGQEWSRADAFVFEWQPSGAGDSMRWTAEGDCIRTATGSISSDTGSHTVPANSLQKREGEGVADECEITLEVHRVRDGVLDPGYGEGGSMTCRQTRTTTMQTLP